MRIPATSLVWRGECPKGCIRMLYV